MKTLDIFHTWFIIYVIVTKTMITFLNTFKGIVHPKMKILSSFTHPQVDPNLYECVCSEHNGRYSEESL